MSRVIILNLKSSLGELQVSLPIIQSVLNHSKDNIQFFIISREFKAFEKFKISSRFQELTNDVGKTFFGLIKFLKLILNLLFRRKSIIILTCDSGPDFLDRILHIIFKRSIILHYHHAFAIHSQSKASDEVVKRVSDRYLFSSGILLNSALDSVWYSSIGLHSTHLVGAMAYTENWIEKLTSKKKKKEKFTVFIATRGEHPQYLTRDNYTILVKGVLELINSLPQLEFILKMHPRQNDRALLENLLESYPNVNITQESTFECSLKADLTVSFWSSSICDSIACGTPSIEFHRHSVNHDYLVNKNGKLVSLYNHLGLCESFTHIDEVLNFLTNIEPKKLEEVKQKQIERFKEVYNIDSKIQERAMAVFESNFQKAYCRKISLREKCFAIYRLLKEIFDRYFI